MTARKTCHYYKKTKCGSTTDNNEPIVVLPDHCDPKINNTVQKFSYFMAFEMSKIKRSYELMLIVGCLKIQCVITDRNFLDAE